MIINLIQAILISAIIIMTYSLFLAFKLVRFFNSPQCWLSLGGKLKAVWNTLFAFIVFFLSAYIVYFCGQQMKLFELSNQIASIVFLSGAIFVLLVVKSNYLVYEKYNDKIISMFKKRGRSRRKKK